MAASAGLDTLLRLAAQQEDSGRFEEAAATCERVLALEPGRPNTWFNLARLQRFLGRFDAALASYQQALALGISQPEEVHLNRGVIFSDGLRRPDDAERELSTALRLRPDYVPALLNLANLHEDRGQRPQALAAYERLLAVAPDAHEGLARYASLRGIASPGDPLVARLRGVLDSPSALVADKASIAFALGKLLDGCGAYDDAFAAYLSANRHSRASPGRQAPYDRIGHQKLIDDLIAAFDGKTAGAAERPDEKSPPLFICGMFRSGSTLAEQVLAGHTLVRAGGEIPFFPRLVATQLTPYPATVAGLRPEQRAGIAQRYRDTLAAVAQGAPHVTDKRPDNYLHIGLIKTLFPNARFIHTTRNPLDNALSIFFLHLDPGMGYALDLAHIAHHYREYRRLMAHWKSLYADDILDFDYDLFVRDPRPAVQRLLQFCGLPWEEGCMAFDRVSNAVRTASAWQVRQPLYNGSSGRWKHYSRHLQDLRAALGDALPRDDCA